LTITARRLRATPHALALSGSTARVTGDFGIRLTGRKLF